MRTSELVIWSLALGAIAAITLARLVDLALRPSGSQARGAAYHAIVFFFVLALCGIPEALWPALARRTLPTAQVLLGPLCLGLSNFWIRAWLNASRRDRTMAMALRTTGLALPLLGLACLLLPAPNRLPTAAALSLLAGILTLWLTVRAWLLGDRLAPTMAAGSLLTLPAIAGLYAMAMDLPMGPAAQALVALSAVLSNAVTGLALWQRDRAERGTRVDDTWPSQFDPVTRVHSGFALVRQLIGAQRRRRRTGRHGAVLAIMVFDLDRVASQVGSAGLNEMFIAIASRIQRQVGVVNSVGRYYDRCFVTMVETIPSPAALRTLGLRVASSLRKPIEVTALDGQPLEIRADIGVGVVHLRPGDAPVEDLLHDAQRLAEAARSSPSRAAIHDAASGEMVAVEHANLGPRNRRGAQLAPVLRPLPLHACLGPGSH
ncbi:MAG TPA: diguanylate cyclase [Ramlibacter sp.]|nr:diguanylate cyclase [Ramlibacter sp.]